MELDPEIPQGSVSKSADITLCKSDNSYSLDRDVVDVINNPTEHDFQKLQRELELESFGFQALIAPVVRLLKKYSDESAKENEEDAQTEDILAHIKDIKQSIYEYFIISLIPLGILGVVIYDLHDVNPFSLSSDFGDAEMIVIWLIGVALLAGVFDSIAQKKPNYERLLEALDITFSLMVLNVTFWYISTQRGIITIIFSYTALSFLSDINSEAGNGVFDRVSLALEDIEEKNTAQQTLFYDNLLKLLHPRPTSLIYFFLLDCVLFCNACILLLFI